MKFIMIVTFALVAIVAADVDEPVKIVRQEFNQGPEGSYNYNFESENGIVRSETGELKEILNEENKPEKVLLVHGSYSYINNDGKPEIITYYADETGYHAEGESIPN